MAQISRSAPLLTVSVAAELAGMHPQTVRQYDRLGLVVAHRTRGGGRRYSLNDVDKLLEIQHLSQDVGVNLAGIARIMELMDEVAKLRERGEKLSAKLEKVTAAAEFLHNELLRRTEREKRVFAADSIGSVTMADRLGTLRKILREERYSRDMVLWQPRDLIHPYWR